MVYQDDILIAEKTSVELGARRNGVEKILNDDNVKLNESKSTKEINQPNLICWVSRFPLRELTLKDEDGEDPIADRPDDRK